MRNLKRIMPQIINWTTSSGENYYKAGKLYMEVIGQWHTYADHVINNIGGIYLNNPVLGDGSDAYAPVPKQTQIDALDYVKKNVFTMPSWLFPKELMVKTFPLKDSPMGPFEYAPYTLKREFQYNLMYNLLNDNRLLRMKEMELLFGKNETWSLGGFFNALHEDIFAKTLKKQSLDVDARMLQSNYVDILLITTNRNVERLASNKISFVDSFLAIAKPDFCAVHGVDHSKELRNVHVVGMSRTSEMVTAKRAELLKVQALLKTSLRTGDYETQAHYHDLLMRINNSLKNDK